MVILNLLIAVEAVLTLFSALYIQASIERTLFWSAVLVITIFFAEISLRERWRNLAQKMIVYGTSLVLIPAWSVVHGTIALSAVLYIVTILFALNMIATRMQRIIINPFVLLYLIGTMSYEYYTKNYIVIIPIEGELAVYYIIIIPVMLMVGMFVFVYMTDNYKREHFLLEQKNLELQRLMRIDTLTGLYNKQFLNEQIGVFMSIAKRNGVPLSVIVIDIDYFKNYNDRYGHIQGDRCLVRVAEAIRDSVLRKSDSVFRFGGEEFVVLLHDVSKENAEVVGQRLVDNIRAAKIRNSGSAIDEYVTISAGLYTYDGKKEMTTNSVIRMADEALYMAKNSGRNKFCSL